MVAQWFQAVKYAKESGLKGKEEPQTKNALFAVQILYESVASKGGARKYCFIRNSGRFPLDRRNFKGRLGLIHSRVFFKNIGKTGVIK